MSVLQSYQTMPDKRPTSVTYQLDLKTKRLGRRMCQSVEAINQAIFLALSVERFNYKIYPPDYGVELEELIGKRRSYVEADIERRINEALMQDDRILRTRDYSFAFDHESLEVQCTADTIFGSVPLTRRFSIGDSTNIR